MAIFRVCSTMNSKSMEAKSRVGRYGCWLVLLVFFIIIGDIKAQDVQDVLENIAHQNSQERILSISFYYEKNILGKVSKSSDSIDALLAVCYRIAERDNDREFKDYLDFYKKTNSIMLIPDDNMAWRETEILNIWRKILAEYQSVGDERFMAITHSYIGFTFFKLNEYAKSIEESLIADEKFREYGYSRFPEMAKYLHNMALIFYFFRQYEKVAELMEISAQLPPYDSNRHIQLYNTLGSAYLQLGQYDKAEKAFIKTKETATTYKDSFWIAFASRGMAKVFLEIDKYSEALHLYESTFRFMEQYRDINKREYYEHILGMAKSHIYLNNFTKAKQCLDSINYQPVSNVKEQMFMFGVSYQDINYWLTFYDAHHCYYYALKNYEKAYYYSDSLYSIKHKIDSTFNGLEVQAAQNRIEAQDKQYENDKKEVTIRNKNKLMLLIGTLLGVIIIGLVLLYRKNRQIHKQNKTIGIQLNEITKTLEQKQVLLSELQHRVKNNLQHVISILEIQKESVDFNNIDELIRGNQNRVHSMALLHKKLNVTDSVNDVDLKKYIAELAELVKDSYDNHQKKITLNITCSIESISIEKALPIGLIIVELVSNSMKHAFKKLSIGVINIEISGDELSQTNKIYYFDNGSGFDFNKKRDKGLGMEIIKGLIDQLDGIATAKNDKGFELSIVFK